MKTILTSEAVEAIFNDCLFKDGEDHTNFVEGEGIMVRVGFHPARLESHREEILNLLLCLPEKFRKSKGGGWSFLNACTTQDGRLWGEHRNVEQLLVLGVATKQARILMPRSMWAIFPGGMPYFVVLDYMAAGQMSLTE